MQQILVHLDKSGTEVLVPIIPSQNDLGQKWYNAATSIIDSTGGIISPRDSDRIYNLSEKWDDHKFCFELNKLIDIINQYEPIFDHIEVPITQNKMNYLHHEFEKFTFYDDDYVNVTYDRNGVDAFCRLNIIIHKWESRNWHPRITVIPESCPIYQLEDTDFKYWTAEWEPGAVGLNYCMSGKKLYDLYKDNDDIVSDGNIRPQNVYSARFDIIYGSGYFNSESIKDKFRSWWKLNEDRLARCGFVWGDPRNAIGMGVVGSIKNDILDNIVNIYGSTKITKISY